MCKVSCDVISVMWYAKLRQLVFKNNLCRNNFYMMIPEDYVCEGSSSERPNKRKLPKGDFRKKNSRLKQEGQAYIKVNTCNLVPPKSLRNCKTCHKHQPKNKLQCLSFTQADRQRILDEFYKMGKDDLQREFINRHVVEANKINSKSDVFSRRWSTYTYHLSIHKERRKVCKQFFLATLAISDKMLRTATGKLSDIGIVEKDRRGGRVKSLLERDRMIQEIVDSHLDRFPRIESHYCRKDTNREYLSSDLTINKMYAMFISEHDNKKEQVSKTFYRRRFREKNLSIHRPKKDQCSLCNSYRKGDSLAKQRLFTRYDKHIQEKIAVRKIKDQYKSESLNSNKVATAVFDLQQVISLPQSHESAVFYKRRLNFFNLTIYELASRNCYCSVWNETASRRGSSEISTCVMRYLNLCDFKQIHRVHLFADGCPGQNKNTIVASTLIYFMKKCRHVTEVTLDYFEPNHGQNEGDSAHSAISTSMSATGEIFVPSQLHAAMVNARRNQPYDVWPIQNETFRNFKYFSKQLHLLSVRQNDQRNGSINWTKITSIKVLKENPLKLHYKHSHKDATFSSITLTNSIWTLQKLNPENLKISSEKYNDLLSLCTGDVRVIRDDEHVEFYKNLPHK